MTETQTNPTRENPYAKYAKVTPKTFNRLRGWGQNFVIFLLLLYAKIKYNVTFEGRENIVDGIGSYIVAANHQSNLDPPLVSLALGFNRHIAYMAKLELYETLPGRIFCICTGTFAVNRHKLEMATIRSCKEVLKSGWHLGIFPEGTRNKTREGVAEVKRGVGFISAINNVPVLPVGIRRYRVEGDWRTHIRVRIGKLIPCTGDKDTMTDAVVAALKDLVDNPGLSGAAYDKEKSPS